MILGKQNLSRYRGKTGNKMFHPSGLLYKLDWFIWQIFNPRLQSTEKADERFPVLYSYDTHPPWDNSTSTFKGTRELTSLISTTANAAQVTESWFIFDYQCWVRQADLLHEFPRLLATLVVEQCQSSPDEGELQFSLVVRMSVECLTIKHLWSGYHFPERIWFYVLKRKLKVQPREQTAFSGWCCVVVRAVWHNANKLYSEGLQSAGNPWSKTKPQSNQGCVRVHNANVETPGPLRNVAEVVATLCFLVAAPFVFKVRWRWNPEISVAFTCCCNGACSHTFGAGSRTNHVFWFNRSSVSLKSVLMKQKASLICFLCFRVQTGKCSGISAFKIRAFSTKKENAWRKEAVKAFYTWTSILRPLTRQVWNTAAAL